MYFEPGRSGTGSLMRGNATDQAGTVSEIEVTLVSTVVLVTGRSAYDLVKVDVEGYEWHAVHALDGIQIGYLFMEVSLNRVKDYAHSELYSLLESMFGAFDVVYSSACLQGCNHLRYAPAVCQNSQALMSPMC